MRKRHSRDRFANSTAKRVKGRSRQPRLFRRLLTLERLEPRQMLSITVNTLTDELDGNIHDGDVSLRDALLAATPFETIDFDPALTQFGAATINLKLGELRITKDVVIQGPGSFLLTIDATGNDPTPDTDKGDGSRVFTINNGSTFTNIDVKMSGMTLTGGDTQLDGGGIRNFENLTATDLTITGNAARRDGGGIFSSGSLVLINSTVSGNSAVGRGGGVFSSGSYVSASASSISSNTANSGAGIAMSAAYNYLTLANCLISGNHAATSGGGILDSQGNLRILDSTISENTALQGGGAMDVAASILSISNSYLGFNHAYSGSGGAIRADATTVTITGTSLFNNSSNLSGGAISATGGGTLSITGGALNDNLASTSGGAIYANGETVTLQKLTVASNSASNGGGIWIQNGALSITESTVYSNRAQVSGGGLYDTGATLTMISSTISGNTAFGDGGGIWIGGLDASSASIQNSTITQNTARLYGSGFGAGGGIITNGATVVSLSNTILANNYHASTHDDLFGKAFAYFSLIGVDSGALLQDNGGSLIGTSAVPIDPLLGPLTGNGGPTLTHLPLPGSPVIDAGDPNAFSGGSVPLFDQRGTGFDRVRSGHFNTLARLDMGAIEVQPGSIQGQKWSDLDGDGVHDADEPGLPGWTIYIDANHNGVFDSTQAGVEPDNYALGTDLSHIVAGATLSYFGSPGNPVFASGGIASTGTQVIGGMWDQFGSRLRVDFANPTSSVSIDVVSDDDFDLGVLEAYDSSGNLLATFYSSPLIGAGQFQTMTVSRSSPDIAYVLASGYNGEVVYLDNLRFGSSEPSTVTDVDGNYTFANLPPGTYTIGEFPQAGWQQTFPKSLDGTLAQITANSAQIAGQVPTRFDFAEGESGVSIGDGGNDMYDVGNVLGTEFATPISYTNGTVQPGDFTFGFGSEYFTAKYQGLFVMAATNTSINSFSITGNNGADSGGNVSVDKLSTTVNGREYTIYVKRVYNAGDPSINHILIVPGNGAGITHNYSTDTNDDYDNLTGLSSVHEIYYALVARTNGQFLASSDILNLANQLLSSISGVTLQTVSVSSGQVVTGIDFGNHALPGSISGQLWYDTNGDGVKDSNEPPLAGWKVYLDTNHDGIFNGQTVTVPSTDLPLGIYDFQTTYSTIAVSGLQSIKDVDVTFNIFHTFDGDLQVYLTSPQGTRIHLFGAVGGNGDDFSFTTLDDEAATGITSGTAPFAGSYIPQELLSAFDGQNPNGIWTLEVSDTHNQDVGTLQSWALTITDTEPSTLTDANGNYSFANLPYGPYVVGEVLPDGWKQTHPGGLASTGLITNGGFESGDFSGWTVENSGSGTFVINNGTYFPSSGDGASAPFDGGFSALTDQTGPGIHAIYQDVAIPAVGNLTLQWEDRIHNFATSFVPTTQEYRVEIRNLSNSVIAVPFSTLVGDASTQDWTARSIDLSAYAGQTIRIAFVEEDNNGYLNVGLDDVGIVAPGGIATIPVTVGPGQNVGGVQFGNQLVLPGDFNLDGSVNTLDYVVWRHASGQSGASFVGADASGNGVVDDADYNIWRSHFGESLPAAGSGASVGSVATTTVSTPHVVINAGAPGYRHIAAASDANGVHPHSSATSLVTSLTSAAGAASTVSRPSFVMVGVNGTSLSGVKSHEGVGAMLPAATSSSAHDSALLSYLSLRAPSESASYVDAFAAEALTDAQGESQDGCLEDAFDRVGSDASWKLVGFNA